MWTVDMHLGQGGRDRNHSRPNGCPLKASLPEIDWGRRASVRPLTLAARTGQREPEARSQTHLAVGAGNEGHVIIRSVAGVMVTNPERIRTNDCRGGLDRDRNRLRLEPRPNRALGHLQPGPARRSDVR